MVDQLFSLVVLEIFLNLLALVSVAAVKLLKLAFFGGEDPTADLPTDHRSDVPVQSRSWLEVVNASL